jgi:hypothetical protein
MKDSPTRKTIITARTIVIIIKTRSLWEDEINDTFTTSFVKSVDSHDKNDVYNRCEHDGPTPDIILVSYCQDSRETQTYMA